MGLSRSKRAPEVGAPPPDNLGVGGGGTIHSGVNDPWGNSYSEVYCPGDQLLRSKWAGGPPTSGARLLRDRPGVDVASFPDRPSPHHALQAIKTGGGEGRQGTTM